MSTAQGRGHGTVATYTIGFAASIILTLAAYFIVTRGTLPSGLTIGIISALATAQLAVQLYFFLHLGNESKPRWNLMVFLFMLLVLIIVVGGTLWIMDNLDYHSMPAQEVDKAIIEDEGYQR